MRRHSASQLAMVVFCRAGVHTEPHGHGDRNVSATTVCPDGTADVDRWPELREPVMIVALTGWVDAGHGRRRRGRLPSPSSWTRPRSSVASTSASCVDLQQTRPTVQLVDGATREIEWPSIDLVAGRAGQRRRARAVGPEPSIRWRAFTDELVRWRSA